MFGFRSPSRFYEDCDSQLAFHLPHSKSPGRVRQPSNFRAAHLSRRVTSGAGGSAFGSGLNFRSRAHPSNRVLSF